MHNKEIYIHLGLHKTGSTFLQKVLFKANAKSIGFLDVRKELLEFRNYLIFTNDLEWDLSHALKLFEESVNSSSAKCVLSEEMFCGNPFHNCMTRKMIFDRLNSLFPNAKYIIVLRNQYDLINSLYLQYVKRGGVASLAQFLSDRNDSLTFSLGTYLNYDAYLSYMVSKIGQARIKCVLYEDFLQTPRVFVSEIFNFLDVQSFDLSKIDLNFKVNKSLAYDLAPFQRFLNKLTKSPKSPYNLLPSFLNILFLKFFMLLSKYFTKPVNHKIVNRFLKGKMYRNKFIKSLIIKDISKYGY